MHTKIQEVIVQVISFSVQNESQGRGNENGNKNEGKSCLITSLNLQQNISAKIRDC